MRRTRARFRSGRWVRGAGWHAAARRRCRPVARSRRSVRVDGVQVLGGARGSELSPRDLLEHFVVEGELDDKLLDAGILGLESLEATSLVLALGAVLSPLAVVGGFGDTDLAGGLGDGEAFSSKGLDGTELGNDALRGVPLYGAAWVVAQPYHSAWIKSRGAGQVVYVKFDTVHYQCPIRHVSMNRFWFGRLEIAVWNAIAADRDRT
ncbi:MAG: hypothetical protein AAGI88_18425 [Pseudomonadota bacterium]